VKIEIITFAGCPHSEATLQRTLEVLSALGANAEVGEVEVRDDVDAARLRFPGSPTIRIDGVDIEPGAESRSPGVLSCRMYGGSGVPSRDLLAGAIARAAARSGAAGSRWLPAAGVPVAGLAALPACPACYPLYAGVLSSLGLTLDPGAHMALTVGLLGLALAALAFRARARRGYAPLVLGAAAGLVVVAGKALVGSDLLVYGGAAALATAGLWNAWPRDTEAPACAACVPGEGTR